MRGGGREKTRKSLKSCSYSPPKQQQVKKIFFEEFLLIRTCDRLMSGKSHFNRDYFGTIFKDCPCCNSVIGQILWKSGFFALLLKGYIKVSDISRQQTTFWRPKNIGKFKI